MTNVMKSAWEIAYEGVEKFGGKVKEYFSEALKIAWDFFKKGGKEVNYAEQVKGTLVAVNFPKLEGSEKQVEWAEKIREKALIALRFEVLHEEYEEVSALPNGRSRTLKRKVTSSFNSLVSTDAVKAHFEELEKGRMPASRFEESVKTMNATLDRFNRFAEIATSPSAKFWIDNRDNKVLENYVATGVKNF